MKRPKTVYEMRDTLNRIASYADGMAFDQRHLNGSSAIADRTNQLANEIRALEEKYRKDCSNIILESV